MATTAIHARRTSSAARRAEAYTPRSVRTVIKSPICRGENMPPGNPNWHLTPSDMRMVFEGKTAGELARQLKDPHQNGGKTLEQIIHHVSEDKLAMSGATPNSRAKMREWTDKGAALPQ